MKIKILLTFILFTVISQSYRMQDHNFCEFDVYENPYEGVSNCSGIFKK